MNTRAIEMHQLRVSAGKRTLLDVDRFQLDAGETLTLLGPNGAGKSTLLRCCLGIQAHCSGEVRVLGQALNELGFLAATRLRRVIGYVSQFPPVQGELPLTVREVVAIGRTGLAGVFRPLRAEEWRIVDEWLERLGAGHLAQQAFSELSGGEQRKVMIARAMAQQPRLLLLDEPTANLDLGWRERMVETIQSLVEQTQLAILLVCHEIEVIPPGCQRVVLLHEGRIMADGSPEEVLSQEQIQSLYGPGLAVLHNRGRHAVVPACSI